jgi:hypothetical protein
LIDSFVVFVFVFVGCGFICSTSISLLVHVNSADLCSFSVCWLFIVFFVLDDADHPHPPHHVFQLGFTGSGFIGSDSTGSGSTGATTFQFAVNSRFHFLHTSDTFICGSSPLLHVHHSNVYHSFFGYGIT